MCMTCGCSTTSPPVAGIAGTAHGHDGLTHTHADGTTHSHGHDRLHGPGEAHDHDHGPAHDHANDHVRGAGHEPSIGENPPHQPLHTPGPLHYGNGPAGNSVPGMSQARLVQIERDILSSNDSVAQRNRAALAARGVFALNLVSSPGSGKTTLLVRTIERLAGRLPVAVIEGDQQTTFDADRIRATGAPALQINTGKGCHLDAAMIETALARMPPEPGSVLMIENVGNLVCPAAFDLGEAHKVVVLSVTEGEDKPLKYPDMFYASSLLLLNKTDLLPHLQFDVARCLAYARQVNPGIEVIQLSATTGAGMDDWLAWIERGAQAARRPQHSAQQPQAHASAAKAQAEAPNAA